MSERARWTARFLALAWMGACVPRATVPLVIHRDAPVRPGPSAEPPPAVVPVSSAPVDMSVAGWDVRIHSQWLRTPAVADGRVYVGGGLGSRDMIAFDARTGGELWRTRVGDVGPTSALVHRGRVIFGTESCHVHSLDAETGAIEWERYLGDPITAAPAAGGGRVFAAHRAEGREQGWALTALSLESGQPEWSAPLPENVLDAPVLEGDGVYLSTASGEVCAFLVTTGERRWCRPVGAIGAPTVYGHEVRVVTWPHGAGGQRMHLTATLEGLDPGRAEVFAFVQQNLAELGACGWRRPLRLPVTVETNGAVTVDTAAVEDAPSEEGTSEVSPRACLDALFVQIEVAPIDRRVVHDLRLDRGRLEVARLGLGDGRVLGSFGRQPLGRVPEMAARGGGLWLWSYEGPRVLIGDEDSVEILGGAVRVRDRRSVLGSDALRWSHVEPTGLTVPAVTERALVFGAANGALIVRDRATGRELSRTAVAAGVASQPVLWDGWVYLVTVDGRLVGRDLRHVLERDARYPMWGGSATRAGRVL